MGRGHDELIATGAEHHHRRARGVELESLVPLEIRSRNPAQPQILSRELSLATAIRRAIALAGAPVLHVYLSRAPPLERARIVEIRDPVGAHGLTAHKGSALAPEFNERGIPDAFTQEVMGKSPGALVIPASLCCDRIDCRHTARQQQRHDREGRWNPPKSSPGHRPENVQGTAHIPAVSRGTSGCVTMRTDRRLPRRYIPVVSGGRGTTRRRRPRPGAWARGSRS